MIASLQSLVTRVALLGATLALLQACAPSYTAANIGGASVADAFETSGTISVSRYDRSIFNSQNF